MAIRWWTAMSQPSQKRITLPSSLSRSAQTQQGISSGSATAPRTERISSSFSMSYNEIDNAQSAKKAPASFGKKSCSFSLSINEHFSRWSKIVSKLSKQLVRDVHAKEIKMGISRRIGTDVELERRSFLPLVCHTWLLQRLHRKECFGDTSMHIQKILVLWINIIVLNSSIIYLFVRYT